MLQYIRREKLGKSGSKFRHGGGEYQKQPKKYDVFYGRHPVRRLKDVCEIPELGIGKTMSLKDKMFKY